MERWLWFLGRVALQVVVVLFLCRLVWRLQVSSVVAGFFIGEVISYFGCRRWPKVFPLPDWPWLPPRADE